LIQNKIGLENPRQNTLKPLRASKVNLYCFSDLYHSNAAFLSHIQVPQIKFTNLWNHSWTEVYSRVFWVVFSVVHGLL